MTGHHRMLTGEDNPNLERDEDEVVRNSLDEYFSKAQEWMRLCEERLASFQIQINLVSGACEDILKACTLLEKRTKTLEARQRSGL